MSELQESIVRSQTILMMSRNYHKQHIIKRVLARFRKCINFASK
jgi:hypothetical protein